MTPLTEKQLTRKLLKVFAWMIAWVVVYVVALTFVPLWLLILNIVFFIAYITVTGRELL